MFRLLFFKTSNHPILGDVEINFMGKDEFTLDEEIYTSVFIGENGTGKSELLKYLSNIFRALDDYKNKKSEHLEINHNFQLIYKIDKNTYEVSYSRLQRLGESYNSYSYYRNKPNNIYDGDVFGKEISKYAIKIKDVELPERILVSSIMLTDKFNSRSTPSYKYLGVRNENSQQVAGTKVYIRRTVDFIVLRLKDPNFNRELRRLLGFLELEENLYISYIPRYRNIFMTGKLTVESFHNSFQNWKTVFNKRDKAPWGFEYYNKIKNDSELVQEIVDFLNKLYGKLKTYGSRGKYFSYDILEDNNISEDFELIKRINSLNLIAYPSISIKKKKTKGSYNLEQSSSGESHLISTIIGLLASIKDNSVVFIDEPEISLHPNWQMKYINFLKKAFGRFNSCHFVIATHSHFMISDLQTKNANIIGLTKLESNKINAESFECDTYGWSVDEILYKVFKVRSTRNIFFENKLNELAYIMTNNSDNKEKISEILKEINPFIISNDDPLNKIVTLAKKLV